MLSAGVLAADLGGHGGCLGTFSPAGDDESFLARHSWQADALQALQEEYDVLVAQQREAYRRAYFEVDGGTAKRTAPAYQMADGTADDADVHRAEANRWLDKQRQAVRKRKESDRQQAGALAATREGTDQHDLHLPSLASSIRAFDACFASADGAGRGATSSSGAPWTPRVQHDEVQQQPSRILAALQAAQELWTAMRQAAEHASASATHAYAQCLQPASGSQAAVERGGGEATLRRSDTPRSHAPVVAAPALASAVAAPALASVVAAPALASTKAALSFAAGAAVPGPTPSLLQPSKAKSVAPTAPTPMCNSTPTVVSAASTSVAAVPSSHVAAVPSSQVATAHLHGGRSRTVESPLEHGGRSRTVESPLERAQRIFGAVDVDSSGFVDPHELQRHVRNSGVSEEMAARVFATIDVNRDGKIQWTEWLGAYVTQSSATA